MNTREQVDVELDHLAGMLPPWLARLRHAAQFWPQFAALARQILDRADAADRAYVLRRLDAMLMAHGLNRQDGPADGPGGPMAPTGWSGAEDGRNARR